MKDAWILLQTTRTDKSLLDMSRLACYLRTKISGIAVDHLLSRYHNDGDYIINAHLVAAPQYSTTFLAYRFHLALISHHAAPIFCCVLTGGPRLITRADHPSLQSTIWISSLIANLQLLTIDCYVYFS